MSFQDLGIGPEEEPEAPDEGYEPLDLTEIQESDFGPDTQAAD
jgi:hypothetical protein